MVDDFSRKINGLDVRVYATRFRETVGTTERQICGGRVEPLLERKRLKKRTDRKGREKKRKKDAEKEQEQRKEI